MRVLAIIPAYNEQDCLEATITELVATCPGIDYLVVNDGSSDATEEICLRNGYPHLSLPVNCGLAAAFQAGMRHALERGYDAAIQFDADGQHMPEFIPTMVDALVESGADIVIGSRTLAGEGPEGARGIGSRLISKLIQLTTGATITDPTSGMRLLNRPLIEAYAHGFDLAPEPDALAMFARKGMAIVEVPVRMRERQGGESYLDLPNVISYMSRTCLSILLFQWFR